MGATAYEGPTPGEGRTITGSLMDKTNGNPIDGAIASVTFTPDKESGRVDVSFSVDVRELAGHNLVAYEVLTQGEIEIAKHEDIEDEGQTVHVREPEKPASPATPTSPRPIPKTGDASVPLAVLATVAVMGCGAVMGAKRLREREDAEIRISRGAPRGGDEL